MMLHMMLRSSAQRAGSTNAQAADVSRARLCNCLFFASLDKQNVERGVRHYDFDLTCHAGAGQAVLFVCVCSAGC